MNIKTKTGHGYAIVVWQNFLQVEALLCSQTTSQKIKIDADNIGEFADTIATQQDLCCTVKRNKDDERSVDKVVRFVHRGPLVDIIWQGDSINKICTFNTAELILQIAPEMLRYLKTS